VKIKKAKTTRGFWGWLMGEGWTNLGGSG